MHAPQKIEQADVAAGLALASQRSNPVIKAAAGVGELTDQEPLYGLSTAVLLTGAVLRNRALAEAGARMLSAAFLADTAKSAIKRGVKRTRPHVLMDEHRYKSDVGGSSRKPEQSFPSGHAAGATAVARALMRTHPQAGAASLGVAAFASLTRVLKGAHFPVDVLGGVLVGFASEWVVDRLARLIVSAR